MRVRCCRRALCIRQRIDLAGNDSRRPFDRRPGHGAARRHPDAYWPDCRRVLLRRAAGHDHAADRILARAARRDHPVSRPCVPQRHRRRNRCVRKSKARVMSELSIKGLSKAFGGVRAVNEVSFQVKQGEFLAMIGPNGAGKSTCFNMINGQLPPDSGEIVFEGRNIAGLAPRDIWRLGVGRTFQVAATFHSMTVAENVQMALLSHAREVYRFWRAAAEMHRERALELLAQVGMREAADRPSRELAYGDVKRVELRS